MASSLSELRSIYPTAFCRTPGLHRISPCSACEWRAPFRWPWPHRFRLLLVQQQDEPLKLKDGRFCLQREIVENGGEAAAKRLFDRFYAEKGLERIKKRVAYFSPKVGVVPSSVEVREIGYRWASCTADGRLSFHWKCMMATPRVIDYIVVHELCHLHQRDHTNAFWNEVDKVMPDYRERKEWLRRNGAGMDL